MALALTYGDYRSRLQAFSLRCQGWIDTLIDSETTSKGVEAGTQDAIDYLIGKQGRANGLIAIYSGDDLPDDKVVPQDLIDDFKQLVTETNEYIAGRGIKLASFNEEQQIVNSLLSEIPIPTLQQTLNKLAAGFGTGALIVGLVLLAVLSFHIYRTVVA